MAIQSQPMAASQKRKASPLVTPQLTTRCFSKGLCNAGKVAPPSGLAVLLQEAERRDGVVLLPGQQPEVVTELSPILCEKGKQVHCSADTVVLNATPLSLPRAKGASHCAADVQFDVKKSNSGYCLQQYCRFAV